ncbi:MAG: hypothetical protein ACTFAL_15120 [Candidatus Electronema sp. V4]|uniref:hypothetical protein n=1 Tax=Candidatus Electronema sp. V4 TaxID=3454756 RepID=UPI004055957C
MVEKMFSIEYAFGNITAKVTSNSSGIIQKLSEAAIKNSFFFSPDNEHKKEKDIYLNFIQLKKESIAEKVILKEGGCLIRKTLNGHLQLFHYHESKSLLLWKFSIDPMFSHFQCCIFPGAVHTSDFFQLAFNRFILQHTVIHHDGLIIHAAGGSINGKGMVFPAVSGTGKSTLSHLLLPHPENQLFSEERIIMRRLDDGWHLWGTPWKGTGVIARNESAPLNALVFLSQAPETKILKLPPSAALRRLLETVSIPWYSQEWTDKGLAVCESLLRAIPAYELAFRPDQTAVQAVAELAASLD